MKKILLFILAYLFFALGIIAQQNIKFTYKSTNINIDVMHQFNDLYNNLKRGGQITIDVLSEKENKKLEAQERTSLSKTRVNKLFKYCLDSLLLAPNNIQSVFCPYAGKKRVASSTNASYKNFTNRKGFYKMAIYKPNIFQFSGTISDTFANPYSSIIQLSDPNLVYGDYVTVYIPPNAFDCDCETAKIEFQEYFSANDILLSGVTTTSGKYQLITGGMIYISAYCNNKEIALFDDKYIEIYWNNKVEDYDFKGFSGIYKRNKIDWELDLDMEVTLGDNSYSGGLGGESIEWFLFLILWQSFWQIQLLFPHL